MSFSVNFDPGNITREEAEGLTALLAAISPALLTAAQQREKNDTLFGIRAPTPAPAGEETAGTNVVQAENNKAVVETKRTRKPKEETKANISASPENRIDPGSPETVAQDAADEKAEVDAGRDPEKPLTVEDVKNALSKYIAKFGMDNTKEDGAGIFYSALGAPPAGEAFWRMSILPSDQASLAKCVAAWEAAAAKAERTTS